MVRKSVLLCVFLFGCAPVNVPLPRTANGQRIERFDYDGHSYVQFGVGNQTWGVHDPDCKCLTVEAE